MGGIGPARSLELPRRGTIQERSRSPRLCLIFLLVMMALGGSACGGAASDPATDGTDCSVPSEVAQIPPDLAALELGRWGTITKAEARAGFLGAEVVSEEEVVEIYPDLVRRLSGPYTFLGGENEGFEAELSFADRRGRVLSLTLTEVACDRVLLRVLIEKGAA